MSPNELHLYNWDGTLYLSKKAPDGDEAYYCKAESLTPNAPPGFDPRWNLSVLAQLRRSILRPRTIAVVISSRPDCAEISRVIAKMLREAGVQDAILRLRDLGSPADEAEYKAEAVFQLLAEMPEATRVIMYDNVPENLEAVRAVAEGAGLRFDGLLV